MCAPLILPMGDKVIRHPVDPNKTRSEPGAPLRSVSIARLCRQFLNQVPPMCTQPRPEGLFPQIQPSTVQQHDDYSQHPHPYWTTPKVSQLLSMIEQRSPYVARLHQTVLCGRTFSSSRVHFRLTALPRCNDGVDNSPSLLDLVVARKGALIPFQYLDQQLFVSRKFVFSSFTVRGR